jgi:hypothetical protein
MFFDNTAMIQYTISHEITCLIAHQKGDTIRQGIHVKHAHGITDIQQNTTPHSTIKRGGSRDGDEMVPRWSKGGNEIVSRRQREWYRAGNETVLRWR